MPIPKPKPYERRNEFISRCMSDDKMKSEYSRDKRLAVCSAAFETKLNINQKISFDYDGTLTTAKGMRKAKELAAGNTLYIISARKIKTGMLKKAQELGIPMSHVYATGSNDAKIEKIKQLKIDKHFDNNADVIAQISSIGVKLAESYDDYPQAASDNAKTALRWADENGWGDCGTPVGKQRANQLANREPISEDTIARMAAFERHRQNSKRDLGDGCGRLMWLAWGGDEGIAWAQRKLEQIRKDNQ